MGALSARGYWLSRLLFQRSLAATYLVAFMASLNQFRPLIGARGILPVPRFLAAVPFRRSPSIFHLHYSDRFFAAVAAVGAVVALTAVVGLSDAGPAWVSMLAWGALWTLYLSIVNVGQVWYGFGWESLLLETGFLAAFLGPTGTASPTIVLWLLRWLLFRLEFGAGLIKLRGDRCWRDLTCLHHHHETQPLPGPLSSFFHHLPGPLHKLEVIGNHVAQLVAPMLLFAPQPVARIGALVIIATQLWLVLSGNFSWLNVVTIAIAVTAVDDSLLGRLLPISRPHHLRPPAAWHEALVIGVAVVVAVLSRRPARNLASRRQVMNSSFDRVHLVNTYGAFGRVTKVRHEVVIEGTSDVSLTPTTEWKEYEFKAKPGDPRRRPPQVAPYHLRLDWMMWFAALSRARAEHWFVPFVARLLENDRATLKLLRSNPFPDAPPRFVRARFYRYRLTSRRQRRETGAWWARSLVGDYLPPVGGAQTRGRR